jgi:hypothetical protein
MLLGYQENGESETAILGRMLKKPAGVVLASFRPSR